jgi:Zn-finger nucleic acid-binding protein
MRVKCPVCRNQGLEQIVVDGIEVDQCRNCRGVWYDKKEYEKLVSAGVRDLQALRNAPVSNRYCPRDGERLVKMTYPQTMVEIDVCPKCDGFWLDKRESDEIRQVRRHLRRVGKVERYAPVPGVKGKLIEWIELQIDALTEYDFLD